MENCKAARCVEINETLGFDASNIVFAPKFGPEAAAKFARFGSGSSETRSVSEAASTMKAEPNTAEKALWKQAS